jgi:metal-responsive CopG/Arc/MetJ family transcriptional regulator
MITMEERNNLDEMLAEHGVSRSDFVAAAVRNAMAALAANGEGRPK